MSASICHIALSVYPEILASLARKSDGSADERPCCGTKQRRIIPRSSAEPATERSSCQKSVRWRFPSPAALASSPRLRGLSTTSRCSPTASVRSDRLSRERSPTLATVAMQ